MYTQVNAETLIYSYNISNEKFFRNEAVEMRKILIDRSTYMDTPNTPILII